MVILKSNLDKLVKKDLIQYALNQNILVNASLSKEQIINKILNPSTLSTNNVVRRIKSENLTKQDYINFARTQGIIISPRLTKQQAKDTILGKMNITSYNSKLKEYIKVHKSNIINKYLKRISHTRRGKNLTNAKTFLNNSNSYLSKIRKSNLISYTENKNLEVNKRTTKNSLIPLVKSQQNESYLSNKPKARSVYYTKSPLELSSISLLYNYFKYKNNYNFFVSCSRNPKVMNRSYYRCAVENSSIVIRAVKITQNNNQKIYKNYSNAHISNYIYKGMKNGDTKFFADSGYYKLDDDTLFEYTYKFDSDDVKRFIKSKKRFLVIHITLVPRSFSLAKEMKYTGHANVIIYDSKLKTLEYFEPHGKIIDYFHTNVSADLMCSVLSVLLNKMKLTVNTTLAAYPPDGIGFQFYNEKENKIYSRRGTEIGYCARWCDWFVDYRLKHENENITYLMKVANEKISKTKTFIRNYTNFLINLAGIYLPECIDYDRYYSEIPCSVRMETFLKQLYTLEKEARPKKWNKFFSYIQKYSFPKLF